mmetsp:Transcript_15646/g.29508  ORF Transcript_15646/g.29508 Transcript_15646/m.29508 type:complete len:607 (+) Transcript_15646:79-1899(+)
MISNYALLLHLLLVSCFIVASSSKEQNEYKTIAIIGGGISGTFTAKYLSDYDDKCLLDITVFSPAPTATTLSKDEIDSERGATKYHQGSRVSSAVLHDGTVVELGASIIFEGNKLVNDMINGDPDFLVKGEPYSVGHDVSKAEQLKIKTGMGIYNGKQVSKNNDNPWSLLMANMTSSQVEKMMLWRYNLDLWRVDRATKRALESFNLIYDVLDSNHVKTFLESPNDVWKTVGLAHAASVSFDKYLDTIGVSSSVSWWKSLFLGSQGVAREELYTAINICNNNQLNSQMTGLAGLVNLAASTGKLFSIKGGNDKLLQSAFRQAKQRHDSVCQKKNVYGNESRIKWTEKMVKTLVSDFESGMELFDQQGKSMGTFDIVVLATPLQFSGINFLGKGSMFDSSVLHAIPLNEMVDSENSNANEHGHKNALGSHLPSSATRPYTQVVTSVISNANLNMPYFNLVDPDKVPRSILFTQRGRDDLNISSISQITDGIYKVFSSKVLTNETVVDIFGEDAILETVKLWGGKEGGATPAFNGGGESSFSTKFMLYDGGHGAGAFDEGSALYYTNAMESAVSAIEISAVGSKFVSKLIARRLGLIEVHGDRVGDEL